ncbi:MAG: MBL fold metallo-hydrolase [Deltaproteobacteria bacterium]|nr:MBL fold metallo-hydrolase [Deltaproteobacteria bacterium]
MPLEEIAKKKMHHGHSGRFFNPWSKGKRRGVFDFLRWRFSRNPYEEEKKKAVRFNVVRPDFGELDGNGSDYAVWLGHSTVFMKAGGKTIITDPVFQDIDLFIKSIKRKTPFPVNPEELPGIDYVLISHGHYDHLDTRTVRFLKERSDPFFITGPGYERYFASLGISRHIVLDWWEQYAEGDIKIRALPVQHWSKRLFYGTDKMLWSSFLLEHGKRKYYWIGDSGYFEGFKEVGGKFGPVDVLFVPVGAYEPRWFMETYHMNPEEAFKTAQDVRAKTFIPIHWGTFDLTDEPLWLPMKRLREVYKEGTGPALKVLEHGGHFAVP